MCQLQSLSSWSKTNQQRSFKKWYIVISHVKLAKGAEMMDNGAGRRNQCRTGSGSGSFSGVDKEEGSGRR